MARQRAANTSAGADDAPAVCVVIPTRNRRGTLVRTLRALATQRKPDGGFEVVVADDGSTDGTREALAELGPELPYPLVVISTGDSGPGAARNAAVATCRGRIVMFLGDDTRPRDEDLIVRHWELHAATPDDSYAVLGFIGYDPPPTPGTLTYWLEHGGPQFAYDELSGGAVSIADYFDCSHSSLKRSLFATVGGFDERFAYYEGAEIGTRMAERGARLEYHPELVVLHDHPMTLHDSLRRVEQVGGSAALYVRVRPDRPRRHIQPARGWRWTLLRKAAPAVNLLAGLRLPRRLRGEVWRVLHLAAYAKGYAGGPLDADALRRGARDHGTRNPDG